MAGLNIDHVLEIGFLLLLALMAFLGIASQRDGSLLSRASPSVMIFRRRRSLRAFMLIMSVFLGIIGPYFAWANLRDRQVRTQATVPAGVLAYAQSTTLIGVGLALGILCFVIPEELRLNLDKRTYRLTKGWPPVAMTRSGDWSHI